MLDEKLTMMYLNITFRALFHMRKKYRFNFLYRGYIVLNKKTYFVYLCQYIDMYINNNYTVYNK